MKNTKIYLLKTAIVGVLVITALSSCKKKEVLTEQTTIKSIEMKSSDYEKVLTFFAWGLGIPKDSVRFDVSKQEFTVPNTIVKESFSRVQKEYNASNEYKLTVESK